MTDRPSVFISYAHKDGMDFIRRLAFALEMYMDVYWDRRLQAGEYPNQLLSEIENRDYFLFVMTPYSLDSEWCQKELSRAKDCEKEIVLARVYAGEGTSDPDLISKYTYGDFTEDFDVGFRRLTAMMLEQPFSSWEYLPKQSEEYILNALSSGVIPSVIAQEVAEWIIAEKLWPVIDEYAQMAAGANGQFLSGSPRTPESILSFCQILQAYFKMNSDSQGLLLIDSAIPILKIFIDELRPLSDSNNQAIGGAASRISTLSRQLVLSSLDGKTDPLIRKKYIAVEAVFNFDVVEKLREFINEHSRRSRYLY